MKFKVTNSENSQPTEDTVIPPIKIKVTNQPNKSTEEPTIKVEVVDKHRLEFELKAKSAVNGDLMIFAHRDIDIILNQSNRKVLAFAKEMNSDFVYGAESRLFEYLRKKGILNYDSIQGGNVYGSMEGKLMDAKEHDVNKIALLAIHEWMQTESGYINNLKGHDEDMEKHLVNPDGEYSTELGEVPHEDQKGSIRQRNLFAPYLYGRYTY
tara:strand:- start:232 stop:861 length:630 start_codon:yes stop_codon:yes gene_type:complete